MEIGQELEVCEPRHAGRLLLLAVLGAGSFGAVMVTPAPPLTLARALVLA